VQCLVYALLLLLDWYEDSGAQCCLACAREFQCDASLLCCSFTLCTQAMVLLLLLPTVPVSVTTANAQTAAAVTTTVTAHATGHQSC
jgi:hypothetical protein